MIYFDVTQASGWRHRSGLMRVSTRLREELGASAVETRWPEGPAGPGPDDWLLTVELFSEAERPGIQAWLDRRPCRAAAVFHDAIPIKLPHITWPASVARHPGYIKLLAKFDRVWAVSAASREELLGFWAWQGVEAPPPVEVLALGADASGARVGFGTTEGGSGPLRSAASPAAGPLGVALGATPARRLSGGGSSPRLLSVGILEPRKGQDLLLDVGEELWAEGVEFGLDLVGRVNPHFGKPIAERIRRLAKRWPGLRYHAGASDATVAGLYSGARAAVFPTIAEGCGLPLLEALWRGVPCVGSEVPSLLENAAEGGCLMVPIGDRGAWKAALKAVLTDDRLHARLAGAAAARRLPTWAEAAATLRTALVPAS
jgi:glycosyltransferase involved in cell wall biosynthesis